MDGQLLILRNESYAAGLRYDQTLIKCSLNVDDYVAAEAAVGNHNDLAAEYGRTLVRLNEHLLTMEQTPDVRDEGNRVQKLLELLDREVDAVQHRLAALKEKSELKEKRL